MGYTQRETARLYGRGPSYILHTPLGTPVPFLLSSGGVVGSRPKHDFRRVRDLVRVEGPNFPTVLDETRGPKSQARRKSNPTLLSDLDSSRQTKGLEPTLKHLGLVSRDPPRRHTRTRTHVCTRTPMHTDMCSTHLHVQTYSHVRVHVHTYVHTRMYTYTKVRTYEHTRMFTFS